METLKKLRDWVKSLRKKNKYLYRTGWGIEGEVYHPVAEVISWTQSSGGKKEEKLDERIEKKPAEVFKEIISEEPKISLIGIDSQIKSEKDKPTLSVDELKRLEDEEVRLNQDIERKVAQMTQLDMEVSGAKPSAELPEGHQGLNETMEALRELSNVTKTYIKEI